jgi:beta-lactamase class A
VKIKVLPHKRDTRVVYFEHRHGVVQAKKKSVVRTMSGLMTVLVVFGGIGVGFTQYEKWQQNHTTAVSSQREDISVDTTKTTEADDLKKAPTKAREDELLAKEIKSKLKNIPGGQKWSVYVRDLNSDRMANVNSDQTYDAVSLANIFTVAALENKVPTSNWGYTGGSQSLTKCVQEMISKKDSSCAKTVAQYADYKNIDSINESLGFKKTTVTDKKKETTARETGELLSRLQNSQVLSDKARRIVFDGLYGQKTRDGIPASCTDKCLIANIAGENKNVRHDAAIVTSGKSKYVVVVMTSGGSWSQIAEVGSTVRLALQP